MSKIRYLMHENKAILSVLLVLAGIVIMVLSIWGYPDNKGNLGSGPFAPLKGINLVMFILGLVLSIVGAYIFYRFNADKSKFNGLINTKSQAIFKKNQIEIERLALRLTSREERIVLDIMRKYRIK